MAINISRVGGDLKVEVVGIVVKYFHLQTIEAKINGDTVLLYDNNFINYTDVVSPVFASAEALADKIGEYIAEYNAGL